MREQIESYLGNPFEKNLFSAAMENLNDSANRLRLNNFAYAMRELTRHFLERLAPDIDVLNAPWFEPNDVSKPKAITRTQRMRYAIQGWLSPQFVSSELEIDVDKDIKNLNDAINSLSKYTHVNPSTFDCEKETVERMSEDVLQYVLSFFELICESKEKIEEAAFDCVDEEMVSSFYSTTFNEIDSLATHHEIEYFLVNRIEKVGQDEESFYMEADGVVNVRLQYGSDGDMKRDDGHEMRIDFPFTSSFSASFKNDKGDVHIEETNIDVDTSSFYE